MLVSGEGWNHLLRMSKCRMSFPGRMYQPFSLCGQQQVLLVGTPLKSSSSFETKRQALGWHKPLCHFILGSAGLFSFIDLVLFADILLHYSIFHFLLCYSGCPLASEYVHLSQRIIHHSATLCSAFWIYLQRVHSSIPLLPNELLKKQTFLFQPSVGAAWLRKLASIVFRTCSLPVCLSNTQNQKSWVTVKPFPWPQPPPQSPLCFRLWTFGISIYQEAETVELPEPMSKEPPQGQTVLADRNLFSWSCRTTHLPWAISPSGKIMKLFRTTCKVISL